MSWFDIFKLGPKNPQIRAIAIAALKESLEQESDPMSKVVIAETIRQMEEEQI